MLLVAGRPGFDPKGFSREPSQRPRRLPSQVSVQLSLSPSPFWSTTDALNTSISSTRLRFSGCSSPGKGWFPRDLDRLLEPRGCNWRLERWVKQQGNDSFPKVLPILISTHLFPNPNKCLWMPGLSSLKTLIRLAPFYRGQNWGSARTGD